MNIETLNKNFKSAHLQNDHHELVFWSRSHPALSDILLSTDEAHPKDEPGPGPQINSRNFRKM